MKQTFLAILAAVLIFPVLFSQEPDPDLFKGLARKYPGDKDIEKDPSVIFAENFTMESPAELKDRWNEVKNQGDVMSVCPDTPPGSLNETSLKITHKKDTTGGHLYRMLKPGYERLFLRFYV